MGYVDENLLPDEKIEYRARLHRIIYATAALIAIPGIALLAVAMMQENTLPFLIGGGAVLLVATGFGCAAYVKYISSEFAVTNRRVLIKIGLIRRHTLELLLQKVEAVGVDQTLAGRILNFGTISVTGTGGSKEEFHNISAPLEFRRQVQYQSGRAGSEERSPAAVPAAGAGPFCTKCGTRNPPGANFCCSCGERISTAAQEKV